MLRYKCRKCGYIFVEYPTQNIKIKYLGILTPLEIKSKIISCPKCGSKLSDPEVEIK